MPSVTEETATATAERLTAAMAACDADLMREIFAPDATIWHSGDRSELGLTELLDGVRATREAARTVELSVTGRFVTDTGFVQTQQTTYHLGGRRSSRFDAAMFVRLDQRGRITRIEEYFDAAALQPLHREILGSLPSRLLRLARRVVRVPRLR